MKNIKNKFPELRYFIENPKGYEVLYYKEDSVHNEYPLDVEQAKEIIRTIDDLQQQLKKKDEVIEKAIDNIDIVIELIKQQPTEDDSWILEKLNSFKIILKEVE